MAEHPEHADEIMPLLALAAELEELPYPVERPEAVESGRERMLAALRHGRPLQDRPSWRRHLDPEPWRLRPALRIAIAILFVLALGTPTVAVVAAGSLPGEDLYPVKTGWENLRVALTISPAARTAAAVPTGRTAADRASANGA